MKLVAVDVRMIDHSGIGTYLRSLLPRLLSSPKWRFLLLGDPDRLGRFPWLRNADCFPLRASIYGPREQWELPRRIPACDLFWSPHFNVPLAPVRARRRLVTLHDVYHLAHPESFGLLARSWARLLFRRAASASDRIITVSEFSRGEIERHLGRPGKVTVIPNGVEADFGRGFERREVQDEYVLFVGNLKPNKNAVTLLEAFTRVAPEFPRLMLHLVGRTDGFVNRDEKVLALARSVPGDRVRLLGEVSPGDLKHCYAGARLLVVPSRYEGFGFPVLEGMSFGLPIAASDIGAHREVAGDAVVYFDPGDPSDMARAIREALDRPRSGSSEAYRDRLARFTWERSAEAHRRVLEDLLDLAGSGEAPAGRPAARESY